MSNSAHTFDDFVTDRRDEEPQGEGGGAALAVLVTLLLGCGLVFAAYKLGQKTGVEDPPLLGADSSSWPVKVKPTDPGGAQIPNTHSASNALIDQRPPDGSTSYTTDENGIVVVTRQLPMRNVDVTTSGDTATVNRSRIAIDDVLPATQIAGAPRLAPPGPVDRTLETVRAGGAEVVVPVDGGRRILPLAKLAPAPVQTPAERARQERAKLAAAAAKNNIEVAALAAPTGAVRQVTVQQSAVPMPRIKPSIARRAVRPAPTETRVVAAVQRETPRTTIATPAALRRVEPLETIGRVPPQPLGDAQIQLGAMPNPNAVRSEWNRLRAAHPDLLGRLGLQVLPAPPAANGTPIFRMRVGPLPDGRSAAQLCSQLQYRGVACFVPPRS